VKWIPIGFAAAVLLAIGFWQFFLPGRLMSNDPRAEIAVLPFQAMAPGKSEFSQSFDESLVTALAQVPAVRVLSPSTVRRYRDAKAPPHIMARILGMDAVLEGTIQVDIEYIRVTARLVDVHSGRIIWASRYDRPAAAGEPVQVSIAKSIARDVEPHLSIHKAR
jgi:TolB-like protein